jgi:hypothetical protein
MFRAKVVEKIKTYILCSVTFFSSSESPAVYEIMRKNMLQPDGLQNGVMTCTSLDVTWKSRYFVIMKKISYQNAI